MRQTLHACLLLLFLTNSGITDPVRRVEDNVLISDSLPAIRIKVSQEFHYLGSFPFRLGNIASGERFVFVEGEPTKILRMFIAQFESFLPESTEIYRYSFDQAIPLGNHRFRQNTFAFSFAQDILENPNAESAFTRNFLTKKGYRISDEWMSSRFLTLGDDSRRSELILFYMEPISSTGYRLKQFHKGDSPTEIWEKLSTELDRRSRAAFQIVTN